MALHLKKRRKEAEYTLTSGRAFLERWPWVTLLLSGPRSTLPVKCQSVLMCTRQPGALPAEQMVLFQCTCGGELERGWSWAGNQEFSSSFRTLFVNRLGGWSVRAVIRLWLFKNAGRFSVNWFILFNDALVHAQVCPSFYTLVSLPFSIISAYLCLFLLISSFCPYTMLSLQFFYSLTGPN